MAWHPPDFRNPTPKKHSQYLPIALKMLIEILAAYGRTWQWEYQLWDELGTYAHAGKGGDLNLILIARDYILKVKGSGGITSAGEDVLRRAIHQGRWLLMYFNEVNKIYVFNPKTCFDQGTPRLRYGTKVFYDFSIKLGVELVKWLQQLSEGPQRIGMDRYLT